MSNNEINSLKSANKASLTCYTVMNVILVLAYLLQVIKHERTWGYYAIFCLLDILPLVASIVIYKADKASKLLQNVIAWGFFVFYLFVLFTTVSPVAYTYAYLIGVILLTYNSVKLTVSFSSAMVVANVVYVAINLSKGVLTTDDMADIEIRILASVLFVVYAAMSTKVVRGNNDAQLESINEAKLATDDVMAEMVKASEELNSSVVTVAAQMKRLVTSTEDTMESMKQVTTGTNETAASISDQMNKTEEIQVAISKVNEATGSIDNDVKRTVDELGVARDNINDLVKKVEDSNNENKNVSNDLDKLNEYTNRMQSITEIINDITSQTSLLALNASIEAARAGEAGKGFAVVATEIGQLANQTQEATDHISELVSKVTLELDKVIKEITHMLEISDAQNQAVSNTVDSFDKIQNAMNELGSSSVELRGLVSSLEKANRAIVDGIESISAATEEVTAHSNQTFENNEENLAIAQDINRVIDDLGNMANKLASVTR